MKRHFASDTVSLSEAATCPIASTDQLNIELYWLNLAKLYLT